jgi:DNA invertase Pin-like site-specific DNA recombinase
MIMNGVEKVTAEHLKRDAYLYIRQSSLKQVMENTESTKRQYALRERAVSLGWSSEQVVVIDRDLGESAAPGAADRAGFERLVTDVSMGRAGLVMGLEVSRLARSCSTWHRLLEICALTQTLVLDQDGLYDVGHINDRLLLGLKAAMSEAELHMIRERLRGGALSKAARGELRVRLPAGLVYDGQNRVVLDPDKQVREALSLFFKTFHRLGTACKTVKYFREQGLKFPKRIHCGPTKGELVWERLTVGRASQVLHSPRYAGAYAFGRSRITMGPEGASIARELPIEQWHTLIPGAHAAYITWEDYKRNLGQLESNAQGGARNRAWPPREGPALLQGLAVCGLCGRRMTVRYRNCRGVLHPQYVCDGRNKGLGMPKCQSISGQTIDEAVGTLLLEAVTPMALDVSLAVHEQVCQRLEEADTLRLRQVERARYEVDLAKRRYMQVDPVNRLVAGELEAQWNCTLRALREAEEEYERQREQDRVLIDGEKRGRILSLSRDFPALWGNPKTPHCERKRMAALLLEDVTLIKNGQLSVNVRFKGGATRSLTLPRPLASYERWTTSKEVVAEIDRLLDDHTYGEIASILNEKGYGSGQGLGFDRRRVGVIRRAYGLKDRNTRLHAQGYLTAAEVAPKLGTTPRMVRVRRAKGTLTVGYRKLNDQGEHMYEDPDAGNTRNKDEMSARTEKV